MDLMQQNAEYYELTIQLLQTILGTQSELSSPEGDIDAVRKTYDHDLPELINRILIEHNGEINFAAGTGLNDSQSGGRLGFSINVTIKAYAAAQPQPD